MNATIKKIIHDTPREITFVVEPETPVTFKTGQAMRWNIPNSPVGRLYSVASPGGENLHELWFSIGILPDGKLTSKLPELKVGDVIQLAGPYGNFIFNEKDPLDIGLIAGGTGISVMHSIVRYVLDHKLANKVSLLFSVMKLEDMMFEDEFPQLAVEYPQFSCKYIVTEPDPKWHGETGFVTKKIFDEVFGSYDKRFYICGPQPFIDAALSILHEAGVPEERIHIDYWKFYPKKLTE